MDITLSFSKNPTQNFSVTFDPRGFLCFRHRCLYSVLKYRLNEDSNELFKKMFLGIAQSTRLLYKSGRVSQYIYLKGIGKVEGGNS